MTPDIRLVAVDIDGTFMRSNYTYDVPRFERLLARMQAAGCNFVVASGNQYWQLRDHFPGHEDELCFVAENGAYVMDRGELVYMRTMPDEMVSAVIDVCRAHADEVWNVLCGVEGAYCERGAVSDDFFNEMRRYCHRLSWVDDLKATGDQILKFAVNVPDERTDFFYDLFRRELEGMVEPTTSGHGSIDLITPGCHKASGLARLAERWGISPEQCVAFGDGGNDVEMLRFCGVGYAMANAPDEVKAAANRVCPSNDEDGVLVALDELFA